MKRIVAFIALLLAFSSGKSQQVNYNDSFSLYLPNSGKKAVSGRYQDSVPEGRWILYDASGRIREIHHYKDGKLTDSFFKYAQGKPAQKGYFSEGKRNGLWLSYEEDGTLRNSEYYVNDTLHGQQKNKYHEIRYEKGKAHGPYVAYTWDNKVRIHGNYVHDSQEGVWVYKGQRIDVVNYEKNQRHGPAYFFTWDSVMVSSCTYKSGVKEGLELLYRPEGNGKNKKSVLRESIWYVNGKKEGPSVIFFFDGDTMTTRQYRNDELFGWELTYNKKGRLVQKRYRSGLLREEDTDSLYRWNDSGKLIEYEQRGRFTKLHKRWNDDGALLIIDSSYRLNNDQMRDYYAYSGKETVEEKHWNKGMMHGRWYRKDQYEYYYEFDKQVKVIQDDENFYLTELHEDGMKVSNEGGYPQDPMPDLMAPAAQIRATLGYRGYTPLKYRFYYAERSQTLLDTDLHGQVILKIFVFQDGTPAAVQVVKSLHPMADAEAVRVTLEQPFNVGRRGGIVQPGEIVFVVEF